MKWKRGRREKRKRKWCVRANSSRPGARISPPMYFLSQTFDSREFRALLASACSPPRRVDATNFFRVALRRVELTTSNSNNRKKNIAALEQQQQQRYSSAKAIRDIKSISLFLAPPPPPRTACIRYHRSFASRPRQRVSSAL